MKGVLALTNTILEAACERAINTNYLEVIGSEVLRSLEEYGLSWSGMEDEIWLALVIELYANLLAIIPDDDYQQVNDLVCQSQGANRLHHIVISICVAEEYATVLIHKLALSTHVWLAKTNVPDLLLACKVIGNALFELHDRYDEVLTSFRENSSSSSENSNHGTHSSATAVSS